MSSEPSSVFLTTGLQNFDATGLLLTLGSAAAILGILTFTVYFWRKHLRKTNRESTPYCGFAPRRIVLRGHAGDVLRIKVQAEGPSGTVFTTYVEEPWLVAVPSSGMMPQEIEVIAYTRHAPPTKKHSVTLRMFPIDGNLPSESLQVEVRLKEPRSPEGLSAR